jgi:hypothetical protein
MFEKLNAKLHIGEIDELDLYEIQPSRIEIASI